MKKTKIICTLGPAVDEEDKLSRMLEAGMDCARLNFSHGTHSDHNIRIERIRKVSSALSIPVAILLDTKGPEIRLCDFEDGQVTLTTGQTFTLDTDKETKGDTTRIGLTFSNLAPHINAGTQILIDDGKIALTVKEIQGGKIICTVINGGSVSNHKSINLPNINIPMPYLSDSDKKDILFGISKNVDFIAASFVRSADDIQELRSFLTQNNGTHIQIISKIENGQGVSNLDEIIEVSDGIMVARGDLGVEIPFEKIPVLQKIMIEKCNAKGKLVITATQMLESMTTNPRPTRAEISDVANAIYDGTTAIMLSGESAAGAYPVEAVQVMANIAKSAEAAIDYNMRFVKNHNDMEHNIINAVCASAYSAAEYLSAKAIIVMTRSGRTARTLSNFRPACPIIAVTMEDIGLRQLKLCWGVIPIQSERVHSSNQLVEYALQKTRETHMLHSGDKVIAILASDLNGDNDVMRICVL